MICRLVLQDESGEQESTPAALHFLADLAEATPTRLQIQMKRAIAAIRSGTWEWAEGLEDVYELVVKIGIQGVPMSSAQPERQDLANYADPEKAPPVFRLADAELQLITGHARRETLAVYQHVALDGQLEDRYQAAMRQVDL